MGTLSAGIDDGSAAAQREAGGSGEESDINMFEVVVCKKYEVYFERARLNLGVAPRPGVFGGLINTGKIRLPFSLGEAARAAEQDS